MKQLEDELGLFSTLTNNYLLWIARRRAGRLPFLIRFISVNSTPLPPPTPRPPLPQLPGQWHEILAARRACIHIYFLAGWRQALDQWARRTTRQKWGLRSTSGRRRWGFFLNFPPLTEGGGEGLAASNPFPVLFSRRHFFSDGVTTAKQVSWYEV